MTNENQKNEEEKLKNEGKPTEHTLENGSGEYDPHNASPQIEREQQRPGGQGQYNPNSGGGQSSSNQKGLGGNRSHNDSGKKSGNR